MAEASQQLTGTATEIPEWLSELVGGPLPEEGESTELSGCMVVRRGGILRVVNDVSSAQQQTRDVFGFKWSKRDTFEGELANNMLRWLLEKYGDVSKANWLPEHGKWPILLDAGCGAALSGLALWGAALPNMRYLGVDVSTAVEVAKTRFDERGLSAAFIQSDLRQIPVPEGSVDLIFSEGVLHHTDSTEGAIKSLARLLKPGGRFLFYVYRRKGPLREFTDDYIRDRLQTVSPEEAWRLMEPLTQLGITLGELDVEIDIPQPVELLDIPAGRINLQRFFYWHVAKAFYRPELSFDEMNHINFDWYAPKNAARQTPEEVRQWCAEAGMRIEREVVEEAGITVIAKKL